IHLRGNYRREQILNKLTFHWVPKPLGFQKCAAALKRDCFLAFILVIQPFAKDTKHKGKTLGLNFGFFQTGPLIYGSIPASVLLQVPNIRFRSSETLETVHNCNFDSRGNGKPLEIEKIRYVKFLRNSLKFGLQIPHLKGWAIVCNSCKYQLIVHSFHRIRKGTYSRTTPKNNPFSVLQRISETPTVWGPNET
ncbi:MAG TPA: hypothetical protein VHY08_22460, partial [Bacillota bacterium]|nr:hypothetical protein [Bacillota bacterium]